MFRDALLDQMDPQQKKMSVPGLQPSAGGGFAPTDPTEMPVGPTEPATPKFITDMTGYGDPNKFTAEHAAKSPKYAFGMLGREYDDTPEGLLAMSKDPRFAQAGFQYVGKDKIMAPDPDRGGALGLVDVGNSFSVGGNKGWQWGAGADQAAPEAGGGMAMPRAMPNLQDLFSGSGDASIQQGVEDYSQPSKYLEALLAQLGAQ